MGIRNSKVSPFTIPQLLKRMSECDYVEDKNIILEQLEQIDRHLLELKQLAVNMRQLKDANGIYQIVKIGKVLIDDIEVVSVVGQILESIKLSTPLMMDFIQFGGLDFIEKAIRVHEKDDYIAMMLPKLQKVILAVGASSSIQEIDHEGVNLQLCRCCQEIIEKNKQRIGSGAKVEIPTSANRINRVLKFMDNYLPRIDVQVAALNAVINFSRNADAPVCARDTDIVTVVSKSLLTHLGEFSIVWRACMAFALLANHHGELAVDIALTNVHENMVDKFPSYIEEPIVQQQVLWLFAALVSWPRSHRLLHKSQKCMTFIVDLIKAADDLEKQKEIVVVDEPELQPKKSMKISMLSLKREEPPPPPPVVRTPLAIPIQLRIFLRETEGKLYSTKTAKKDTNKATFKQRKNFDERPKFGTVEDTLFVPGEEGLLRGNNEDDEGNKVREKSEWEQKLSYGEEKEQQ